ncbi:hypothetical protein TCAL_04794 [Tigriopus californicus]|uniref:J domain-containing protein n=1 Tax=Tigriopus californicus TaxID=6832 RepID=A0A553PS81_TIGCA|nr:capping protein inhibiting regulator of actin dynamics-like [Tigriopus californicus]TRY80540.1 hypothetical protein TCAL_04794 [Tigriopus californicus]|eukprot:TCALIF_04794-PA protein Name:"Protein of unknown function" AED:0.01 eAED:0.01 QI:94/1/0.6/1/1/1/5/0/917
MILKDQQFYECARILKLNDLVPSDPDKKQIERAFRKLALKTHPDKGGEAKDFRKVNEAYNRLIAHITKIEAIEADTDLANSSVIIEISSQAIPHWIERFNLTYGRPRTDGVKQTFFEGPVKQWKGHGGCTGSLIICLYEDPEDKIPKIHCRCEKFMRWLQELNLPLHMHVQKGRKIRFDQWRIMSMAEFGFCRLSQGSSARHDWKDQNAARNQQKREKEDYERRRKEEEERKKREEQEERERLEREKKEKEEEERRKKREEEAQRPWWHKHVGRDYDYTQVRLGETTPPPEDLFPNLFDPNSPYFTSVFDGPTPETTQGYKPGADDFFAYKKPSEPEEEEGEGEGEEEKKENVPVNEEAEKDEKMRSVSPDLAPEESDQAQVLQDILNEKRSRFDSQCSAKKPRPVKPTVIDDSDSEYRQNIRSIMKGLKSNKSKSGKKSGGRRKSSTHDLNKEAKPPAKTDEASTSKVDDGKDAQFDNLMGEQDAQEIFDAHDESSSDLEITTDEDALSSPMATRKWDKNTSGGNTEARLSTPVKDSADPAMVPSPPDESNKTLSQATLAENCEKIDEKSATPAETSVKICGQEEICTPSEEVPLSDLEFVEGVQLDLLHVCIEKPMMLPEELSDLGRRQSDPKISNENDLCPLKLETLSQTCYNNDCSETEENERELDKQSFPASSEEFVAQEGYPVTSPPDISETVASPESQECLSEESAWEIKLEPLSPSASPQECLIDIVTPPTDGRHTLKPLNSPPMRSRRQNKPLLKSEPHIDVSRGQDDPTKSAHPVDSSLVKDNGTNDSPRAKHARFKRQKAKFHRSQSTNTLDKVGKETLGDCHFQGSLKDVKGGNQAGKSAQKLFQSKQDLLSPRRLDTSAQVGKLSAMFERQASMEALNHSQRSKSAANTPRFERKSYGSGWSPT